MTKDAIVSEDVAKKFAKEKETPYTRWVKNEGLDIIDGIHIPDLNTVELKPWPRRNARGVYINHDASRTSNDCYVCEIAPGDEIAAQRQLYEEMIMVLSGRGSTTVWNDAGQKVSFEWQAGALFAIPVNTWHQHYNGSGKEKVRFVAVTNLPPIMNVYEEPEFIFNTPYDFKSRFSGEPDYFAPRQEVSGLLLETNFVVDAVTLPLVEAKERGAGGGHIRFNLAKSSMNSHISQFPVGTYKKAHAHGPGAHVIVLAGKGYSLMWPEGEEPKRYDWKPGTLITPPNMWFHQHFNAGDAPARYLAFKYEGVAIRNAQGVPKAWISRRIGGHQIDYADEAPAVRTMFAETLARIGLEPRMDEPYELEKKTLPPLPASRS